MRTMKNVAGVIVAVLLFPTFANAQGIPAWMIGYWLSCTNNEQVSETWVSGNDHLFGIGVTVNGQKLSFEMMRIGKGASSVLSFFASPNGVPATEFPLKTQEASRVVFENLGHDFPQRVVYARDGKDLTARIEGTMNGKTHAIDWRYAPATLNAQCPSN